MLPTFSINVAEKEKQQTKITNKYPSFSCLKKVLATNKLIFGGRAANNLRIGEKKYKENLLLQSSISNRRLRKCNTFYRDIPIFL
jgi:phage antirepressor YoqD-like protein